MTCGDFCISCSALIDMSTVKASYYSLLNVFFVSKTTYENDSNHGLLLIPLKNKERLLV